MRSRWAALTLATLAHALGSFSMLAVAPLAPFILDGLGLSRGHVGLLVPAAYLGGVAMSLPAGWLTDRLGVRLTLALGLGVIGAAVGLAALARDLPAFLACLMLGGFGFSVLNPATGRVVVDWFPPRRRGVAMGVKQTGLTMGGVAAALTLPVLAVADGWRTALGAAAGVALASALVTGLLYRDPVSRGAAAAPDLARLRDLRPFLARPAVRVVFGAGLAMSMAQSSLLAYLVLYAKQTFVLSSVDAGRLLALAQVGGTATRVGWGIASDRWFGGRRRPGVVASALLAAVAYALFAVGQHLTPTLVVPLALVAGAGAFGWVGLYFALVAEIGGARYAGLLTGVAVAFAWSGVLIGPPLFGLLLELSGSYAVPWVALAVIAVAVAVTLPRLAPLVQRD